MRAAQSSALLSTPERRLFFATLLVRLIPAALIFGSEDIPGSQAWGYALFHGQNPYITPSGYLIAWPPLWIPFATLAYWFSATTPLPFYFVIKLFYIAADLIIVFVLYSAARQYRLDPFRTAMLYALNPIAIYTSALHGNFDPVPALCALTAVVAAHASDDDRAQNRAAVWLGIGAAFKTWPLFILPALVAPLRTMIRRVRVASIATGIFTAALLLPALLFGWSVVTDALGYRSNLHYWGLTSIAYLTGGRWEELAAWIFYAAMIAVALLVMIRRPPAGQGALAILLTFLVTTPGFGNQYLVWLLPIAILVDRRRAFVYSVLGGVMLAWEIVMRPYAGHLFEMFRYLPHANFAREYGSGIDRLFTIVVRLLVLYPFVLFWWATTVAAIVRRTSSAGASPRDL